MLLRLYCTLIIANFISIFTDSVGVKYIVGILAIFSWVFSVLGANKIYKIISLIFTVMALVIFMIQQIPINKLPLYMTSNVTLLTIFFVLPFINSIIVVGRYERNASKILKSKVNHMGQLYSRSTLVSFILGGLLNIATIPLVISVVEKNLKTFKDKMLVKNMISKSMLRGFAISLAWSPMEIMIAISLEITKTNYLSVLPLLLLFCFTLLLINWMIGRKYNSYFIENKTNNVKTLNWKNIREIIFLLLFLCVFIFIIISIHALLRIGFLAAVSLVIVPFSFLWALIIKRYKSFLSYAIPVWKSKVMSLKGYMLLFLSVGFFTSSLSDTAVLTNLQKPFLALSQTPVLLFLFIQIIFIVFAMIGFHSLVTITILGEIVKPLLTTIEPMSLCIVLISSGLSPTLFSPFNISASITANIIGVNPFKLTWWNIGFAFLYSSVGTFIALCIHYFFA